MGMTVVVTDTTSAPSEVVHPGAIAPVDASNGATVASARLAEDEDYRWQPKCSKPSCKYGAD